MKKASLLLLCWLNAIGLLAQVEGHLYDQTTNESIPFVNIWVQGQTVGTTSDEKDIPNWMMPILMIPSYFLLSLTRLKG